MTSKEALNELSKYIGRLGGGETLEEEDIILRDLEILENIKSKTLLFYTARKRIAKEYEKWCKDNNAMVSDTTNMITWLLCFKLKEWLENA